MSIQAYGKSGMNIVDPILFQCKYSPSSVAICAPGTRLNVVSYGQLERWIHNISRTALSLGLEPGQIAAIFIKDKIFHAAVIYGLTRIGVVTLSARDPQFPSELRVDAVITDTAQAFGNVERIIHADRTWIMGDGEPLEDARVHHGSTDEICRIILTSGSTGEPKAVAFSHKMLADRISRYAFVKGDRFPHGSRLYCDLGIDRKSVV